MSLQIYENVKNKFLEHKCTLLTREEEFNDLIDKYPKYKYIASCGHEHIVYFHSFLSRKTGVVCPNCITKINGEKRKKEMKEDKLQNIKLEFDCITYFLSLLQNNFIAKKAFDGCLADIIIKPNQVENDAWLGIQVKTCFKVKNSYSFHCEKNYKNLIILCVCWENKKMWLIPYSDVQNQIKISIGLNKSKYEKYEITPDNVKEKIQEYYYTTKNFSYEILDTPLCEYQKREKEFYKFRESKIDFLKFEYNEMEGFVYDFKIENKKVQEKVAGVSKNTDSTHVFQLCKNSGKSNQICYEEGDSDIYWLNCSDKINFYVIPEHVLIEKRKVKEKNSLDDSKKTIKISPKTSNWLNPYKFNYEEIDQERLTNLFL
jgi:hypothetical protein